MVNERAKIIGVFLIGSIMRTITTTIILGFDDDDDELNAFDLYFQIDCISKF